MNSVENRLTNQVAQPNTDDNLFEAKQIPDELIFAIFLLLSPLDIPNISLVCKKWKTLSDDEQLWKFFLIKYLHLSNDTHQTPSKARFYEEYQTLKLYPEGITQYFSNDLFKLASLPVLSIDSSAHDIQTATFQKIVDPHQFKLEKISEKCTAPLMRGFFKKYHQPFLMLRSCVIEEGKKPKIEIDFLHENVCEGLDGVEEKKLQQSLNDQKSQDWVVTSVESYENDKLNHQIQKYIPASQQKRYLNSHSQEEYIQNLIQGKKISLTTFRILGEKNRKVPWVKTLYETLPGTVSLE